MKYIIVEEPEVETGHEVGYSFGGVFDTLQQAKDGLEPHRKERYTAEVEANRHGIQQTTKIYYEISSYDWDDKTKEIQRRVMSESVQNAKNWLEQHPRLPLPIWQEGRYQSTGHRTYRIYEEEFSSYLILEIPENELFEE